MSVRNVFFITFSLYIPFASWSQMQFPGQEHLKELMSSGPIKEDQYFRKVINGSNQFGFNFYQHLKNKQGDLVFSPFDISSGVAMVGLGAKGQTLSEIQSVLNYSTNLSSLINDLELYLETHLTRQSQMAMGNAIWLQDGLPLVPSFKNAYKKSFNLDLVQLDFSLNPTKANRFINQWMSSYTFGKISQILNPGEVNKQTLFILTTAFFFQQEWQYEFDRRKTVKAPFHYNGHPFQVEMMNRTGSYRYLKSEQFEMVEIPFAFMGENKPEIVMSIFLPKEGINLDLLDVGLNNAQYSEWVSQLQPTLMDLFIPKFKIDGRYDLHPLLDSMGMKLVFSDKADFSAMTSQQGLSLDKAVHKTSLRIEERGKEVTKIIPSKPESSTETAIEKPLILKIDRPFFFTVRDRETNLILLMGRLTQP